jgi:hypothetical protein
MSREPEPRPPVDYAKVVLARLYRDTILGGRETGSFLMLCTAANIPADLRAGLLQELTDQGYVTDQDFGQIGITARGIEAVIAPSV